MSAAAASNTLRTRMPLMSMPRMAPPTRSASSAEDASLTPPALPRPPTRTCALMTTASAPPARIRSAATRTSATVWATSQAGTGRPWATSKVFASASWIFTGRRSCGASGREADGTASSARHVEMERTVTVVSPYSVSAATSVAPPPRGEMQQELVERARRGDHDAFAALAGAALFRLDAAARLILRDPDQAKDAVQEALVRAWRDLPTLRDPARFDAWLHRLLYRACIDESRRLRRHRVDVDLSPIDRPDPDDATATMVDRDQIERGFSRLEPEARALLVLHHYLDLPLPAAAG